MRSDDWHLAHTEDGIETYFRKDAGDNTLAWRTSGEIDDCPVISQVGRGGKEGKEGREGRRERTYAFALYDADFR